MAVVPTPQSASSPIYDLSHADPHYGKPTQLLGIYELYPILRKRKYGKPVDPSFALFMMLS